MCFQGSVSLTGLGAFGDSQCCCTVPHRQRTQILFSGGVRSSPKPTTACIRGTVNIEADHSAGPASTAVECNGDDDILSFIRSARPLPPNIGPPPPATTHSSLSTLCHVETARFRRLHQGKLRRRARPVTRFASDANNELWPVIKAWTLAAVAISFSHFMCPSFFHVRYF